MLELTFNGHANFHMTDGDHAVIFDPWFTGNPSARISADDAPEFDAILATHGHSDHLGDAVELSKARRAPIVAPFELAMFCQRRGAMAEPMNHGGKRHFDFGLVRMTWALHSSAFVGKGAEYTGHPCGFIVEMGGYNVYFAGDTALFGDMKLLDELYNIDIAILPIGDNFTMGPQEAAKAVELLSPRFVVPMHYGTFEVLEQGPGRFVELTKDSGAQTVVLGVGDTHRFE